MDKPISILIDLNLNKYIHHNDHILINQTSIKYNFQIFQSKYHIYIK